MKTSDSISNLAAALAKVQPHLRAVGKDAVNPAFKSKYASLDAIIDAVRPPLAQVGLSIVQGAATPHTDETGRVVAFSVETLLLHHSGEWISNAAVMPLGKHDPQGAGGALTYGRRYGLSALLCLATDEDDDAESAMPPRAAAPAPERRYPEKAAPAPKAAPAAPAATATRAGDVLPEVLAAAKQHLDLEEPPACPKCGGQMWDNREKKASGQMNPKAPDFKCRNREGCDGVIWPPRDEQKPAAKPAAKPTKTRTAPQDFSDFPEGLMGGSEDDLPF